MSINTIIEARLGGITANFVYNPDTLSWDKMTQPALEAQTANLYVALDTVEAKLQSLIEQTDTVESKLQSLIDQTSELEGLFTGVLDYDVNANLIYQGKAATGSSKASAVWQIKKFVYDGSGNLTDTQWADGNANFDNVWTNRVALSYS